MSFTPEERERRRRAKRFNEGVRLVATLLNNLAVGTIVAGILSPLVSGRAISVLEEASLFLASIILHLVGQIVLRTLIKSED